ncbi:MAG TPA: Ni/Fe-hydrogenase, b-type cytochrome subunit [Ktedonobacterales bacterium]|nr:Ni/Fe-hydrogenase, b-type cytochrome subunit [Ktedonobacterales bacterium]
MCASELPASLRDDQPRDAALSADAGLPIATGDERTQETVYVWDMPLRISHWLNVLSIVALSVTGYYIAAPFIQTQGAATNQFLMGTVRFVHFVFAFMFSATVLFRIYWAFAGNHWANWRQFIPTSRARLRSLRRMLRYYTFFRSRPPEVIGHNPLAGVTYVGLYGLFALQIITGFALYALPLHSGFIPWAFGWINIVFGEQYVRLAHDFTMWLIIAFTIHHVYSAILIDIEERSGLVSSIVTGYKTLSRAHIRAALRGDPTAGDVEHLTKEPTHDRT